MRVAFFVKEAFRALRRNAAPSLAALVTILLTALVLGVFIPVVQATTGTANDVRERVVVDVFLKEGSTDAQRSQLRNQLLATPNVRQVEFVSKEEALKEQSKRNKAAFELLGSNPLPDAFRVSPKDPDGVNTIVDRIAPRGPGGDRVPRLAGVDEVRNRERDTERILDATGLVKALTASLAALFILASVALVANTIRLSLFARRREIEVMKLVGATNWFVRTPFMLEGLICGLVGSFVAVLLLLLAKEVAVARVGALSRAGEDVQALSFPLIALVLVLTSLVVGAAGSGITLRRFLRI